MQANGPTKNINRLSTKSKKLPFSFSFRANDHDIQNINPLSTGERAGRRNKPFLLSGEPRSRHILRLFRSTLLVASHFALTILRVNSTKLCGC